MTPGVRVAAVVVLAGALLQARQTPQAQQAPLFRTRIDLMQLDVTVLDKDRKPVRELTKDDFILLEDKTPQTIQGFAAIDLPERRVEGPAWARTAPADVTTNEIDNQRIFVIVLDDARGMGDLWAKREMRRTATQFVDMLGDQDLAAIVFTGAAYRLSQNLTSDRAKLLKAIQSYPDNDGNIPGAVNVNPWAMSGRGGVGANNGASCLSVKEVLRLMEAIVGHLSSVPDRRKAILYFGGNLPWVETPQGDPCGTYWMWRDVFTAAQQGHVTINPVDTKGLTGRVIDSWASYGAVASNTGGHAVINSNDFMPGVRQIYVENSSYYLIAYQPTHVEEDGTFRRITLKVNRPDMEVVTRRSYWAPRAKPADQPVGPPPSPEIEALAGLLPLSKLALRITAAPFAIAGGQKSVVALTLGVRQPAFDTRTRESVEVLIKAFTADGDEKSSETQVVLITVPAAPAGSDLSRYDVLARIEVPKPGKYELRLSAQSSASGDRGSVYVDVEVPDFRKEKLSLSGVVVDAGPGAAPVAPPRMLADVTPVAPTTERAFTATDLVTAFLRAYQGGNDKLAPVTMAIRMQDAAGSIVFRADETLAADQFNADRAAEFRFRVPLAALKAGDHLLTFEAAMGKARAKRDVRLTVR